MTPLLRRTLLYAALGAVATVVYVAARSLSGDAGSISTATPHAKQISAAQYGDAYPFTVDGQLFCQDGAIALKVGDAIYAINGTAQSKLKAQPLEPIWKTDPQGQRVNVGQIISDGQQLCP